MIAKFRAGDVTAAAIVVACTSGALAVPTMFAAKLVAVVSVAL